MKNTYTPPICPKGLIPYEHKIHEDLTILCFMYYELGELGDKELGIKVEPDFHDTFTLTRAYIRDVEIFDILSVEMIESIEASATKLYSV